MKRIRYIEIENFKVFDKLIHVDLGHPAVLIGPNNAGKTSVIQALALWNRGIKAWYDKKGQPERKKKLERISAGINRLNILELPVSETRFFWNNTRVRRDNKPIALKINVGVELDGKVYDCRLEVIQQNNETIYCRPCQETAKNEEIIRHAANLQFSLLYPMSGLDSEEPLVLDGRIGVLMGQGQTAQVLRNLCYKVIENDRGGNSSDWASIADLMKRLFQLELREPQLIQSRGTLALKYKQNGADSDLDISLAGRGLQQMLLILAYLYSHKESILLIDEPDAHLEILRQKQVYEILKEVAQKNQCQVVIATHSEVILDDAVETNLTLLINGEAVNLAKQVDMRLSLRTLGIEHYYKAKIMPHILYIEGSTDLEILKTLAEKLKHPAYYILSGRLNYFYTCNIEPIDSLENKLDRFSGAYSHFRTHFFALKKFVKEFKGLAIFDSDNKEKEDDIKEDLAVVYWKQYELENYFITPEVILKYINDNFQREAPLFKTRANKLMETIIDKQLLQDVFQGDSSQLEEYRGLKKNMQRTLLRAIKMSKFTEEVFKAFADQEGQPILLSKGEYYQLIQYVEPEDIPKEVKEKLDMVVQYLKEGSGRR